MEQLMNEQLLNNQTETNDLTDTLTDEALDRVGTEGAYDFGLCSISIVVR
jgi:hypothetical protein